MKLLILLAKYCALSVIFLKTEEIASIITGIWQQSPCLWLHKANCTLVRKDIQCTTNMHENCIHLLKDNEKSAKEVEIMHVKMQYSESRGSRIIHQNLHGMQFHPQVVKKTIYSLQHSLNTLRAKTELYLQATAHSVHTLHWYEAWIEIPTWVKWPMRIWPSDRWDSKKTTVHWNDLLSYFNISGISMNTRTPAE